ncbi:hypothetical protein D5S18_23495 [Nocardia panacis]|uniref:Uncharacterized protein n=2 Tax=Nocardia panacis TaxID=2340916 RepID=A0A3A4KQI9_9NOCA|nr:hypothetical protein D5S18_23495 [Nocardia panacis]
MQFPDESSAAKAATELEDTDFRVAAEQNAPVLLPKYQNAHAHWRPGIPSLGSTLAIGRYVLYLNVGLPDPDLAQLVSVTEQVYDRQLPMLDKLPSLTRRQILELELDPHQVLDRTLVESRRAEPESESFAAWGLQGYLNRQFNATALQRAFETAGADGFGQSAISLVIRTRDRDAAHDLAPILLRPPLDEIASADPVPKIPNGNCAEHTNLSRIDRRERRFTCAITYNRYVSLVGSEQLIDAHQLAAAQYALLANTW